MKDVTIGLLTDFGLDDTYVGVMKAVIAGLAPRARIIDLTHNLPPGDIRLGAFKLWQSAAFFPSGSILVAVVDPGVGTQRRAVAVAWRHLTLIAPDNGLLTYLLAEAPPKLAVTLSRPEYRLPHPSSTFHGRDIFAPVAGHLARGAHLDKLGPPARDLVRFDWPRLELLEGPQLRGELLHHDRFGNWITSLGRLSDVDGELDLQPWLPSCAPARLPLLVRLRALLPTGLALPIQRTFADVAPGTVLAYIGSEGLLEIAVNRGSAAARLPLESGQEVLLTYEGRTG
ncbi:MAG TPA: SAM-dependent chlorinase/fluorinase [Anaerolineales bacterium]|nr:SAM-dependent chlorinase/fluorinase [Anaerolineales bacterium]